MAHIVIISSSVRTGRVSNRVASYLMNYLTDNNLASSEILDLNQYNFNIFNERLKHLTDPPEKAVQFAASVRDSDGVIIVVPEYNGGYPASLKNVIDLLTDEWHRKPVAIATVSNGHFGGSQVITSLLFVLWKMKAWVVPATFPVPVAGEAFTENGIALNKTETEKRAGRFISELLWCITAKKRMEKTI